MPKPTKSKVFPNAYVTIAEVESFSPCFTEYKSVLNDFKSNPTDTCQIRKPWFEPLNPELTEFPKSRYKPKSKIYLSDVLRTKSTSKSFSADFRVRWVIARLPRLQDLDRAGLSAANRRELLKALPKRVKRTV